MECGGLVSDLVSPESTVTSLLSSSGHLRSSLLLPEHNTTYRYRDKNYDSASVALDAYIADFERSHQNSGSLTGQLVLPHSPLSTPSRPRVHTLRNKDVLRESLTDRELDFLNLPVSSLCHRDNRERLSMTTEELLSIPYDGSMPVTHTSAFIQGLLSQSGTSRRGYKASAELRSSHAAPRLNHSHPHLIRTPRSCRSRGRPDAVPFNTLDGSFKSAHKAAGSQWENPPSSLHLPRWFTSNKADMDCSEMSNVPDLKYPAWIQHCDLNESPPPPESELWNDHAPRTRAPSWVAELEDDDPNQTWPQADSQQTLRDLSLQFAEQISLLATERKSSDIMETPFTDRRIEALIQKVDQVLNSLSQSCGRPDSPADSVHPVNTEELLLSSPSRCAPFSLDSEAAGGVTEAQPDRGAQARECSLHGNSIWKQPGPVEALKQMLFRLQALEAEVKQQQRQQQASLAPTLAGRLQTEGTPMEQGPEGEFELEGLSGGLSLERALHHLSCLKLLVEEPRQNRRVEQEEKDEDEGRYSSSSAEGLLCTQQKSSLS